jgi:hypothetical protein
VPVVVLVLQRRPERFGGRVVPARPGSAHRAQQVELDGQIGDLLAGVLGVSDGLCKGWVR